MEPKSCDNCCKQSVCVINYDATQTFFKHLPEDPSITNIFWKKVYEAMAEACGEYKYGSN